MQSAINELIKAIQYSSFAPEKNLRGTYTTLHPQEVNCSFIDGSNALLVNTPGFCAQMIRIACVSSKTEISKLNIKRSTHEFFSLAKLITEQTCEIQTFGTNLQFGSFDVLAEDLRQGLHAATPLKIQDTVRKIAELQYAKEHVEKHTVLVLDGELTAQTLSEEPYVKELSNTARIHNSILVSLSKTTTLVDTKGISIPAQLLKQGPQQPWLFVATTYSCLGFVKLHTKSNHVFKLQATTPEQLVMAANALAMQANDAQLLGYPYGLIAVDQLARITLSEARMQSQHLLSITEQEIASYKSALDAHMFF